MASGSGNKSKQSSLRDQRKKKSHLNYNETRQDIDLFGYETADISIIPGGHTAGPRRDMWDGPAATSSPTNLSPNKPACLSPNKSNNLPCSPSSTPKSIPCAEPSKEHDYSFDLSAMANQLLIDRRPTRPSPLPASNSQNISRSKSDNNPSCGQSTCNTDDLLSTVNTDDLMQSSNLSSFMEQTPSYLVANAHQNRRRDWRTNMNRNRNMRPQVLGYSPDSYVQPMDRPDLSQLEIFEDSLETGNNRTGNNRTGSSVRREIHKTSTEERPDGTVITQQSDIVEPVNVPSQHATSSGSSSYPEDSSIFGDSSHSGDSSYSADSLDISANIYTSSMHEGDWGMQRHNPNMMSPIQPHLAAPIPVVQKAANLKVPTPLRTPSPAMTRRQWGQPAPPPAAMTRRQWGQPAPPPAAVGRIQWGQPSPPPAVIPRRQWGQPLPPVVPQTTCGQQSPKPFPQPSSPEFPIVNKRAVNFTYPPASNRNESSSHSTPIRSTRVVIHKKPDGSVTKETTETTRTPSMGQSNTIDLPRATHNPLPRLNWDTTDSPVRPHSTPSRNRTVKNAGRSHKSSKGGYVNVSGQLKIKSTNNQHSGSNSSVLSDKSINNECGCNSSAGNLHKLESKEKSELRKKLKKLQSARREIISSMNKIDN